MTICVTSEGKTLDSRVDPRFGRCQNFIFVDPDSLAFEAVENPNLAQTGGAGIQSGQLMASKGVKAVLTGNIGPNAYQTLTAAGIEIYTGVSGSVKEAVEAYKSGRLEKTQFPSVASHSGMPGESK